MLRVRIGIVLLCLAALTVIGTAALYLSGNAAVVARLCRLGLPNTTMPKRFWENPFLQPCVIYGSRERFSGVLWSDGFESSGFFPYPFVEELIVHHDITWPGISVVLDDTSDPHGLLRRFPAKPFGGIEVAVTFDGWPSVSRARFGHLGAHDEEILIDRLITVATAPEPTEADYDRWRRAFEARNKVAEREN